MVAVPLLGFARVTRIIAEALTAMLEGELVIEKLSPSGVGRVTVPLHVTDTFPFGSTFMDE
jgi:hypothetical protein